MSRRILEVSGFSQRSECGLGRICAAVALCAVSACGNDKPTSGERPDSGETPLTEARPDSGEAQAAGEGAEVQEPPASEPGGSGGETAASAEVAPEAPASSLTSSVRPADDRPPRPEWASSVIPVGAPGWKSSEEPLCEGYQGLPRGFDIWADQRGVFVSLARTCNAFRGPSCGNQGREILHNDGSGWVTWYHEPITSMTAGPVNVTGFPNGDLVVSGELGDELGVFFLGPGDARLTVAGDIEQVFVANERVAYAWDDTSVIRYSSGGWDYTWEVGPSLTAVWSDGEVAIAVGQDQTVRRLLDDGVTEAVSGAPAGGYASVWGFSATDFWLGNDVGQLIHYEDGAWETFETGSKQRIHELWGYDGGVYFATVSEFGRYRDGQVEIIVPTSAGLSISEIWGRSENEVFLAINDGDFLEFRCGATLALWFDGEEFHSF